MLGLWKYSAQAPLFSPQHVVLSSRVSIHITEHELSSRDWIQRALGSLLAVYWSQEVGLQDHFCSFVMSRG
jgi:hypothetical protein